MAQSAAINEKKRQRELLRQIWMATEKDEMMTCMKILKSEDLSLA
jgi:dsDNA-binding SOS-regulon protein